MNNPKQPESLDGMLDFAYEELFWISEAPNRGERDDVVIELAERARAALIEIERRDRLRLKAEAA